jgi:hypothetical protein
LGSSWGGKRLGWKDIQTVYQLTCTQRCGTKYFRSPRLKDLNLSEEARSQLHSPMRRREDAVLLPTAFTEGVRQVRRSDLEMPQRNVPSQQVTPAVLHVEPGFKRCASRDLLTTITPSCGVPIQHWGSAPRPSTTSLQLLGPQIRVQPIRPVASKGTLSNWADMRLAGLRAAPQAPPSPGLQGALIQCALDARIRLSARNAAPIRSSQQGPERLSGINKLGREDPNSQSIIWRCFRGVPTALTSTLHRQRELRDLRSASATATMAEGQSPTTLLLPTRHPPPLRIDKLIQVSTPIPLGPHVPSPASQGGATLPEVVRVQRLFLADDTGVDIEQLENWSLAHVLREYIDPGTKMKMLRLRYANDEEDDVCEGAVHRPLRVQPPKPKKPYPHQKQRTSCTAAVDTDLPARSLSPPRSYCGRLSSAENSTSGSDANDGSPSESDVTVSDVDVHMATTKRQRSHAGQKPRDEPVARTSRVEGQSGAQHSPSAHAPDSESIMLEGEYALRGRPRVAMGAPHILQSSRGCVEEEGCIGRGQASRRG